jgi:uncharacterized protein YecE (DUF72 family)
MPRKNPNPPPDSTKRHEPPASLDHLRIGPAGWSYSDWSGYVYPSPRPKGFHEATYLAQFFDTIEINTSFYNPLQPDHAKQWLDRVAPNPRFIFTAKLWQKLTHELSATISSTEVPSADAPPASSGISRSARSLKRAPSAVPSISAEDDRAIRAGFDVLHQAGKLGAVLLQFPISFHHSAETSAYLHALIKHFAEYPLAVELRHASWNHPDVFALLRERNVALCNLDQPLIGRSLPPSDETTASLGYVRLHGRRYDTWFSDDPEAPMHERYNYLYSREELTPWAERIRNVAAHTRTTFVITNNHYLGKAVVNALELLSMLKSTKVQVPDPLRLRYPELESIAANPPQSPTLFPLNK